MHPAVMLRFYRLRTAARLVIRAGPGAFRIKFALFQARGARRSWLRAVEGDVDWLAKHSSLFSELATYGDNKITEYFNMCRSLMFYAVSEQMGGGKICIRNHDRGHSSV